MNNVLQPKKHIFLIYLLPGIILYTFTVFVPIVYALYYGFFNWSGGMRMKYIGLKNFADLLKDDVFWQSFSNNIILTVVCIIGQIGFAFLFAMLLNSKYIKFKSIHRTMAYLPVVLSAVVVGFIWSMIYDFNYGLLNTLLKTFGATGAIRPWLSQSKIAIYLVSIPLVWQFIGFYLVILMAAFSSIDKEILEMAEIDGANGIKKVIYVTLPMVKNTILVCVTLCIAGNMKAFDHIYVMTAGGPGTATSVMALYAYNTSFIRYQMGYGSAMSIFILVLSLVLIGGSRSVISYFLKDKEV